MRSLRTQNPHRTTNSSHRRSKTNRLHRMLKTRKNHPPRRNNNAKQSSQLPKQHYQKAAKTRNNSSEKTLNTLSPNHPGNNTRLRQPNKNGTRKTIPDPRGTRQKNNGKSLPPKTYRSKKNGTQQPTRTKTRAHPKNQTAHTHLTRKDQSISQIHQQRTDTGRSYENRQAR